MSTYSSPQVIRTLFSESSGSERLPTFIIAGAAKAGTTSIYHYLKAHPQVFMSPIKEPSHFCSDIDIRLFTPAYKRTFFQDYKRQIDSNKRISAQIARIEEREYYTRLFREAGQAEAIGECSTLYLPSSCAARQIRAAIPKAKIVLILRNPIDRAYSHYLMDVRIGYETGTFRDALEKDLREPIRAVGRARLYVEFGLYHEQVSRYAQVFGPTQLKVFLHEDLKDRSRFFASCTSLSASTQISSRLPQESITERFCLDIVGSISLFTRAV